MAQTHGNAPGCSYCSLRHAHTAGTPRSRRQHAILPTEAASSLSCSVSQSLPSLLCSAGSRKSRMVYFLPAKSPGVVGSTLASQGRRPTIPPTTLLRLSPPPTPHLSSNFHPFPWPSVAAGSDRHAALNQPAEPLSSGALASRRAAPTRATGRVIHWQAERCCVPRRPAPNAPSLGTLGGFGGASHHSA